MHLHRPQTSSTRSKMGKLLQLPGPKILHQHYGEQNPNSMTVIVLSRCLQKTLGMDTLLKGPDRTTKQNTNIRAACDRQWSWQRTTSRQAFQVHSMMKDIMKMTKDDLKRALQDRKDTIDSLKQYGPLETRTIDKMRLSLLSITAFDRLWTMNSVVY